MYRKFYNHQSPSPSPAASEEEAEEPPPVKKGRPRKVSQKSDNKRGVVPDDTDVEDHSVAKGKRGTEKKAGAKRKRKADTESAPSESEPEQVKRRPSSQRRAGPSKASSQSQEKEKEETDAVKPKKRKINLFTSANDMPKSFTFGEVWEFYMLIFQDLAAAF